MKIVIRAGGSGTRLWPLSRNSRPKQFLPFFEDGSSCVQAACRRFIKGGLAGPGDVFVSVGSNQADTARRQLPELPASNIIVEPARRDTAAAIALETIMVAGGDPDVIIASLGSDHYVGRPDEFIDSLRSASEFLSDSPDKLLAVACRPTRVETGYGHIRMGRELGDYAGRTFYEVEEFTEKPDYATAKKYTESGRYFWNANFFVWTSGSFMALLKEFRPEMHNSFMKILEAKNTENFTSALHDIYPGVEKVAVDYAILEPAASAGKLAVLPASLQWSDIGTWASITDAFPCDSDGNLFRAPVHSIDTKDCTFYSDNDKRKLIAAIGVENLALIDTEDALLLVSKDRAEEVKALVESLKDTDDYSSLT